MELLDVFPEKKQTPYNQSKPHILFWSIKTIAQNEERGNAFNDRRDTIPRPEALNEIIDDAQIPRSQTEQ